MSWFVRRIHIEVCCWKCHGNTSLQVKMLRYVQTEEEMQQKLLTANKHKPKQANVNITGLAWPINRNTGNSHLCCRIFHRKELMESLLLSVMGKCKNKQDTNFIGWSSECVWGREGLGRGEESWIFPNNKMGEDEMNLRAKPLLSRSACSRR